MKDLVLDWWAKRAQREQYMLLGGGIIILVFLLVDWVVLPTVERMKRLDRMISEKERQIGTFDQLSQTYQQTHDRLDAIISKLGQQRVGFSLVAYIEQMTIAQRVNYAVVALRPYTSAPFEGYQETAVELSLEKVSLAQTVSFLQALESSPHYIQVKRFSMKSRFSDSSLLDIQVIVSSYAPATTSKTLQG